MLTTSAFGSDIGIVESPKVEMSSLLREKFKDLFTGETGKYVLEEPSIFELNNDWDIIFPNTEEKRAQCLAFATKFQDYITSLSFVGKETEKAELLDNLLRLIEKKRVSPPLLSIFALISQGLQSQNISDYEKDFFAHLAPLDQLMNSILLEQDSLTPDFLITGRAFKSIFTKNSHASNLNIFVHPYRSLENVSYEVFDRFRKDLESSLYPRTFLPVLGKGFLGYHFLIENIIQKRFPIAVPKPSDKLSAHGIEKMSPLGFTLHDLAHIFLDGRMHFLSEHGLNLFEELIKSGINYKAASPVVIKRVVAEDNLLTETLASFLKKLDEAVLLEKITDTDYKKSLYGFFFMMHEVPQVFGPLLNTPTLAEIFGKIESLEQAPDVLKTLNPLNTLHTDGSCPFNDVEIQDKLSSNFEDLKKFMINASAIYPPSQEDFATSNIDTFEVKRSNFTIDLTVTLQNGAKRYFSIPTLYQHYTNMMHSFSSLNAIEPFGEINLEPQTSTEASRNMDLVRNRIFQYLKTFGDTTSRLSQESGLNEDYAAKYSAIVREFEEGVTPLRPLPEEVAIRASQAARIEIAKNLLKLGTMTDETIITSTGISQEQLEATRLESALIAWKINPAAGLETEQVALAVLEDAINQVSETEDKK